RNGANDPLPSDPAVAACWVTLNSGQSAADVDATTIPTIPIVPGAGGSADDAAFFPTSRQPATAAVLGATAGADGINPLDPTRGTPPTIQSSFRYLQRFTLHPGAS